MTDKVKGLPFITDPYGDDLTRLFAMYGHNLDDHIIFEKLRLKKNLVENKIVVVTTPSRKEGFFYEFFNSNEYDNVVIKSDSTKNFNPELIGFDIGGTTDNFCLTYTLSFLHKVDIFKDGKHWIDDLSVSEIERLREIGYMVIVQPKREDQHV